MAAENRLAPTKRLVLDSLLLITAVVEGFLTLSALPYNIGVYLGLAAAAGLLLRRRVPEVALLVALPGFHLANVTVAPMFALYSLAAKRGPLIVSAAAAAAMGFVTASLSPVPEFSFTPFTLWTPESLFAYCMQPAAAVVAGRAARARRKALQEVEARQASEKRLVAERVLTAERARIAREMHDVVSHKVSLISLQAGALQVGRPEEADVKESAQLIHELSAQTVTELHHMLGVLRPAPGPAVACGRAFGPGLADLPELVRISGMPVRLGMPEKRTEVPEAVQRAAYRTVQEALTNIRKHAPESRVEVSVTVTAASLDIEVRNGPSAGSAGPVGIPGNGRGLAGLAERAGLLGGEFAAGPAPDGGFAVVASYPLTPPDPDPDTVG
ncbi:histidine kinase [Streptomyces sp. NPDC051582]|uniref:sensor histidine kinase n=1 Tax=Streptomyces sp. NPDC051582 TaxID=3155167 RepID=UPI00342A4AA5